MLTPPVVLLAQVCPAQKVILLRRANRRANIFYAIAYAKASFFPDSAHLFSASALFFSLHPASYPYPTALFPAQSPLICASCLCPRPAHLISPSLAFANACQQPDNPHNMRFTPYRRRTFSRIPANSFIFFLYAGNCSAGSLCQIIHYPQDMFCFRRFLL